MSHYLAIQSRVMAKGGVKVRDILRIGTAHETVSKFYQTLMEVAG
jgi:hypothetical protein